MNKVYSSDFKTTPKNKPETDSRNTPRTDVLNNILNFSKALEVLKTNMPAKTGSRNVEIVLN